MLSVKSFYLFFGATDDTDLSNHAHGTTFVIVLWQVFRFLDENCHSWQKRFFLDGTVFMLFTVCFRIFVCYGAKCVNILKPSNQIFDSKTRMPCPDSFFQTLNPN